MANILNAGPIVPVDKGVYSSTVKYSILNLVDDGTGQVYLSRKNNNLGNSLTDEEWWGRYTGKSAYELAVENGYEGTEAEWLESLRGGGIGTAVLYTPQTITDNQKAQARTNIGAGDKDITDKFYVVDSWGVNDISDSNLPLERLEAFHEDYGDSAQSLLIPLTFGSTNSGYIVGNIIADRYFGIEFIYNNTYYKITRVDAEDWTASTYQANGVVRYDITVSELTGSSISSDTMTKLNKLREDAYEDKMLAIRDGYTDIPFTIKTYGSVFEGYFVATVNNTLSLVTVIAGTITPSADWTSTVIPLEKASNKVTTVDSSSTDAQYPSAKAVYTAISNSDSVFDISEANNGASYATLSSALSAIPDDKRKGGMSIKFIQSSDNRYVQYRYMGIVIAGSPNPFLDIVNWQGVDDKPTALSPNLITSGSVNKEIDALKGTKLNYVEGKYYQATYGYIWDSPTAMIEEEYISVTNGDEIYWDFGGRNTTINLLIYDSSKTKIDNKNGEAANKSFTISNENAAYIRASFNLEYKDKACIKVNGNVVWYATDNVSGYIPQQIENNNDTIVENLGLVTKVNIGDIVEGNECNYYDGYKYTTTNTIIQDSDYIVSKPIPLEVGATYTWWHGLQGHNTMGVIRIKTATGYRRLSASDTRYNESTSFTAQSDDICAYVTFAKNYADNRLEKGTDVIYRPTVADAGVVEEIIHIVNDTDIREELVEVPTWTNGAIDINTGAIVSVSGFLVSQFIPVKAGEMYRLTGYSTNTENIYRLFAGYSAADESTFIQDAFPFINSSKFEQSIVTIIPDGVNYIRVMSMEAVLGSQENILTGTAQGVYHITANKYDGNLKQIGFSHLLNRVTTPTTINNRKYFTLATTNVHGAYCSTALIPVKSGDKFTILKKGETTTYWYDTAFYDASCNLVGGTLPSRIYENIIITAPENAAWLYIALQNPIDKCYIGSNEPISNNVENRYVKDYLDNVEYDNTDYSYSMVQKYCFLRGFNHVDQPNGFKVTWTPDANAVSQIVEIGNRYGKYEVELTNDVSSFNVFNVVPNESNICKVSAIMSDESRVVLLSQKIQPRGTLRMIKANSLFNVRDVGGWITEDGHRVKYNSVFRGCTPSGTLGGSTITITETDKAMMVGLLGLAVEVDLAEASGTQTESAFGESVEVVDWDSLVVRWSDFSSESNIAAAKTKLVGQLTSLLSILQEGKVIYLHCFGGADRTGVSMMNLEAILGVQESEMLKDYELTSFSTYGIRERNDTANDHPMQYVLPLVKACEGANLSEKWINWLSDSGLTTEMVNALREIMLV